MQQIQQDPARATAAPAVQLSPWPARLLIGALVLFSIILLAVTLPEWFTFLQAPCAAPCEDERLTVSQWFYAHRAGISPTTYATVYVVQVVALAALCFGIALLLVWQRPRERVVGLAAATLVMLGATFFTIDEIAFRNAPVLALLVRLMSLLGFLLFPLFFYTFPDGRFTPRWTRWLAALIVLLLLLYATPLGERLQGVALLVVALYALPPIYAQIDRYRNTSSSAQRQQTKWAMFGFVVAAIVYFVVIGIDILFDASGRMAPAWKLALEILKTLGVALIPITIGISVLRYRLYDIDIIIRRTIQYTIVMLLLVLAYAGSVLLLQQAFRTFMGRSSQLTVVLSTLAIAALFGPLRLRVEKWVNTHFHRSRYNAQQVVEQFVHVARDETDAGRLSQELERVLHETLQPARISVWLREPKGRRLP